MHIPYCQCRLAVRENHDTAKLQTPICQKVRVIVFVDVCGWVPLCNQHRLQLLASSSSSSSSSGSMRDRYRIPLPASQCFVSKFAETYMVHTGAPGFRTHPHPLFSNRSARTYDRTCSKAAHNAYPCIRWRAAEVVSCVFSNLFILHTK